MKHIHAVTVPYDYSSAVNAFLSPSTQMLAVRAGAVGFVPARFGAEALRRVISGAAGCSSPLLCKCAGEEALAGVQRDRLAVGEVGDDHGAALDAGQRAVAAVGDSPDGADHAG